MAAAVGAPAAPRSPSAPAPVRAPAFAGEPLTAWPRDLEEVIEGSGGVRGYPAIVDREGVPTLTVLAVPDARAHARGVRRLLLGELALPVKRVTTRWTGAEALALGASPYREHRRAGRGPPAGRRDRTHPGSRRDPHRRRLLAPRAAARARAVSRPRCIGIGQLAIVGPLAARDLDGEIRAATSLALLPPSPRSAPIERPGRRAGLSRHPAQPLTPRAAVPNALRRRLGCGDPEPEPRRRRSRGTCARSRTSGSLPARRTSRAMDDRGIPGVALRPAAGHRRHRQRAADPEGARRARARKDPCRRRGAGCPRRGRPRHTRCSRAARRTASPGPAR